MGGEQTLASSLVLVKMILEGVAQHLTLKLSINFHQNFPSK